MPKELKEMLGERLVKRAREIGMPDLVDKIADETVAVSADELAAHLERVNHPVLQLPPLM
jgi:acetyl-CoA synthase